MASKQIKVKVTILNEIDKIIGNHGDLSWSKKLEILSKKVTNSNHSNQQSQSGGHSSAQLMEKGGGNATDQRINEPMKLQNAEGIISPDEQNFLDMYNIIDDIIHKNIIRSKARKQFGSERVKELLK